MTLTLSTSMRPKIVVAYSNVTDANKGAERAGIPNCACPWSQCDYLDMRPETDQASMGKKNSCNLINL